MSNIRDEAGCSAEGPQVNEGAFGGAHLMVVGEHVPQTAAQQVSALLRRVRRLNRHLSAESVEGDRRFLFRWRRLPSQSPEIFAQPQCFFVHLLRRRVIDKRQRRPLPPFWRQFPHQARIIEPVREQTLEQLPAFLFCQALFQSLSFTPRDRQHDQGGLDTTVLNREDAKSPWEGEPLRSRRAEIEQQCFPMPFSLRLMRVTEDADVRLFSIEKCSAFLCQLATLVHYVANRDPAPAQLHNQLRWEPTCFVLIDIAGDGCDRRDSPKLLDDRLPTDIAGVDDVIHSLEMAEDYRIEEAMRVSDDADADRA